MTDRGVPTPENIARPRRRIFTLANGLMLAGAVTMGGATVDEFSRATEYGLSPSPAQRLVSDYENTTYNLGRVGELSQIPQKFDSQEVAAAYKEVEAEFNRNLLDVGILLSGMALLVGGVLKSPRKS